MKRRDFVAAAAAVTAWPALKAFACPPPHEKAPLDPACGPLPVGADDVSAAYRQAVRVGKPLLVILVPADSGQKYDRGQLWGEVLNHGAPSTFAALACVEVVCATVESLAAVVPGVVVDSMLFVLVETATMPATSTMHGTKIPDYPDHFGRGGGDGQKQRDIEKQLGGQRIAALGGLIEEAVLGTASGSTTRPLLGKRVTQARAALALRGSTSDDDQASILLEQGAVDRVAAAATARLKGQRVRGSKWAIGGGCGVSVEGENDDVGIACGMGHTPELSRRFLYWFTR